MDMMNKAAVHPVSGIPCIFSVALTAGAMPGQQAARGLQARRHQSRLSLLSLRRRLVPLARSTDRRWLSLRLLSLLRRSRFPSRSSSLSP